MKLTKEECLEALELLKETEYVGSTVTILKNVRAINIMEQLIEEHFKLKKDFESVCSLHDGLLENYESLQRDYKQLKEDYESLKEENKQFESLSKAKKLIEHVAYKDDYHYVKVYRCPTCGSIKTNLLDKHCTECGQRFVEWM